MRWKLMGGNILLKKDALPKFFSCQPTRRCTKKPEPRSALIKLNKKRSLDEMLSVPLETMPSKHKKIEPSCSNLDLEQSNQEEKLVFSVLDCSNDPKKYTSEVEECVQSSDVFNNDKLIVESPCKEKRSISEAKAPILLDFLKNL